MLTISGDNTAHTTEWLSFFHIRWILWPRQRFQHLTVPDLKWWSTYQHWKLRPSKCFQTWEDSSKRPSWNCSSFTPAHWKGRPVNLRNGKGGHAAKREHGPACWAWTSQEGPDPGQIWTKLHQKTSQWMQPPPGDREVTSSSPWDSTEQVKIPASPWPHYRELDNSRPECRPLCEYGNSCQNGAHLDDIRKLLEERAHQGIQYCQVVVIAGGNELNHKEDDVNMKETIENMEKCLTATKATSSKWLCVNSPLALRRTVPQKEYAY